MGFFVEKKERTSNDRDDPNPLLWPLFFFQCAPSLSLSSARIHLLFVAQRWPSMAISARGPMAARAWASACGSGERTARLKLCFGRKRSLRGVGGFGALSQRYKSLAPFPASSSLFSSSSSLLPTPFNLQLLQLSVAFCRFLSLSLAFSDFDHSVSLACLPSLPLLQPSFLEALLRLRVFPSLLFLFYFNHIQFPLHPYHQDVVHYCLSVSPLLNFSPISTEQPQFSLKPTRRLLVSLSLSLYSQTLTLKSRSQNGFLLPPNKQLQQIHSTQDLL